MALLNGVSYKAERTLRTIFKRCLECPKRMPSCPKCPTGKVCSLVPGDCNKCAYMTCIADPATTSTPHGPNVGAIAGGVVAGVAFVAIAVFLVWRFWIKKQREEQDRELEEKWREDGGASRRSQLQSGASSTRTRASLATSILSRASNIIQIAYIPGVTNRGNDNNVPVPPIPAAFRSGQQTPKSPLSNEGDMLFFRPGDLRGSTWSDSSSFMTPGNRDTQYTVHSITPSLARSSVASDAFFVDDATAAPMPTHSFKATAPRMVSIKSNGSTPSPEDPTESKAQTLQIMMPGNSSRNMSGSVVRAKQVQVSNGKGRTVGVGGGAATKSPLSNLSQLPEAEEETEQTNSAETPSSPPRSPFDDPPESTSPADSPPSSPHRRPNPYASMASTIRRSTDLNPRRGSKSIGGLAVIEESARNSTVAPSVEAEDEKEGSPATPVQAPESEKQQQEAKPRASEDSPFSDTHASE